MDRIQRSHDEIARLRGQSVSEVTPSRRDFAQYVAAGKDEPAIVAALSPTAGRSRDRLAARAVDLDDAEVAAICLSLFDGLDDDDMAAISGAVTAPILRHDPLLDASQLYHSRLHGADAVVLPAAVLDADDLAGLVDVAVSMHMAVVIDCVKRAQVEAALRWPYAIIGTSDIAIGSGLGRDLPAARTLVLLSPIAAPHQYEAARGVFDAVVVAPEGLADDDVVAAMQALRGG